MSGLWSFREPGVTVGATGERQFPRQTSHIVTQVLPTGVEYKKSLLLDKDTEVHTMTVAAACACDQPNAIDGLHLSAGKDSERTAEDGTGARASLHACSSSPTHSTRSVTMDDMWPSAAAVDLVDRDEAVGEVQRSWWRSLSVDTRPAIDLPSSAQRSGTPCTISESTLDEEAVRTAHQLLARAASAQNSRGAEDGGSSSLGERASVPVVRAPPTQVLPHQGRRSNASKQPSRGGRTGSETTSVFTPQKQALRTAYAAPRPMAPSTIGAASHAIEQGAKTTPSVSLDGQHNEFSDLHKRTLLCPLSSPNTEAILNNYGNSFVSLPSPPLDGSRSELLLLTRPSEPLRTALKSTTAPRTDMQGCAAAVEGPPARHVLVLLGRFFSRWRAAAEARRIQRCSASYHRYLMECVRDALGESSLS